jgi:hypothetical protein
MIRGMQPDRFKRDALPTAVLLGITALFIGMVYLIWGKRPPLSTESNVPPPVIAAPVAPIAPPENAAAPVAALPSATAPDAHEKVFPDPENEAAERAADPKAVAERNAAEQRLRDLRWPKAPAPPAN